MVDHLIGLNLVFLDDVGRIKPTTIRIEFLIYEFSYLIFVGACLFPYFYARFVV